MSGTDREELCGSAKSGAAVAKKARTAPAGTFHGGKPPPGPKPEPVRLNGVPSPKTKGVSH